MGILTNSENDIHGKQKHPEEGGRRAFGNGDDRNCVGSGRGKKNQESVVAKRVGGQGEITRGAGAFL